MLIKIYRCEAIVAALSLVRLPMKKAKPDSHKAGHDSGDHHAHAGGGGHLSHEKKQQIVGDAWKKAASSGGAGHHSGSGEIGDATVRSNSPRVDWQGEAGLQAYFGPNKAAQRAIQEADKHAAAHISGDGRREAGKLTDATGDKGKKVLAAKELEEMKKLLGDSKSHIAVRTSAQVEKAGKEADIIIGKDGEAHLNPHRKAHKAGEAITVELVTDNHEAEVSAIQAASNIQKAAVRDLIGYFKMQNPTAPLPSEWVAALSKPAELPPPTHRVVISGGGGGGLRSGDGGGYSGGSGGSVGAISHNIPREVPAGARVGSATAVENQLANAPALKDSLNLHKFVDRVVAAVSGNEGNFKSINPNDAGYGVSVGIRQWNQKTGELPTLLKEWDKKDHAKFEQIFGKEMAAKLLNEDFVRNANFLEPGLMGSLKTALADKEFQDVQVQLSRDFVVQGMQLGLKYGFKSELGLALVVDICNQCGFGGAEKALKKIGGAGGNEQDSINGLNEATHRSGGAQRLNALKQQFNSSTQMEA